MKSRILVTAALSMALAACGSQNDQADASTAATDVATDTPAAPLAGEPQAFIDKMSGSDMFEIEAAKVAQKMGKSQKVKDFAAMMIKDHTASSEKLKAAAGKTQPPLTVAPALTPDQKAKLDTLRAAGDDFDKLYAEQQVAAHEEALTALKSQADAGSAPALKEFATATATVVGHHLEMARELP
jgi:putative membrane protein